MKKSFKVVSLGVAALSGLILNEVGNSSVAHADTISTSANKTTAPAVKVTDEEISNAQKKVDNSKKDVDTANEKVDQAQQKVDNSKKDLNQYKKQKPTDPSEAIKKQEEVVRHEATQKEDAKNDVNQAETNVANQKQNVEQAQNKADQAAQNVTKAQQAQTAQKNLDTAKNQQVTNDHLAVSQSYVDATKKFNDEHTKAVNEYVSGQKTWEEATKNTGMQNPEFTKTMKKASEDSCNLNSHYENYQSSEKDKHTMVNVEHMTNEQNIELSQYAMDLINSVREKVGSNKLTLNQDAIDMAQDIAKGYVEDGRDISNGYGHDPHAINEAAKKYDLSYVQTNKSTGYDQYYENMGSFYTNENVTELNKGILTGGQTVVLNSTSNDNIVTMDYLKKNIYGDVIDMLFNNEEWKHAFALLEQADHNTNLAAYGYNKTPKFGMALSILPNSNLVSTHYIIINNNQNPSKKHFNADTDIHTETPVQKHDEYVSKLTDTVNNANANVTAAKNAFQEKNLQLRSEKQTLAKLKADLNTKQKAYAEANQKFNNAANKLNEMQKANNATSKTQYYEQLAKYNKELQNKEIALRTAEKNLKQANAKLAVAKDKLNSDTNNLTNLQNIQKAQKIAEEEQEHNQDQHNTSNDKNHTDEANNNNQQGTTPVEPDNTNTSSNNENNKDMSENNSTANLDNNQDNISTSQSDNTHTNVLTASMPTITKETAAKPQAPSGEYTAKQVTLTHNAYVYDNAGVAVKENGAIVELFKDTDIPAWFNAKTVTINGKKYFQIDENKFVKVANTLLKIELTHNAYIYDKEGNVVKNNGAIIKLFTGSKISAWFNGETVTINGKKFYQIGENRYVKVDNTVVRDHAKIKLTHNARVYVKKHGKVVKKRLIKKGKVLKALRKGRTVIIKGKQYYQIGKNEYIKAGNARRLLKEI